jgi:hypothetical protein
MKAALARALRVLRPPADPPTDAPGSPPRSPTAAPLDPVAITAERCRKRVTQRALMAAGVAMVPVPGVDWVTDVGLLVSLLPEITTAFGLSPAQVERLAPERRVVVYKAISAGSSLVLGRVVTRELVMAVLKTSACV